MLKDAEQIDQTEAEKNDCYESLPCLSTQALCTSYVICETVDESSSAMYLSSSRAHQDRSRCPLMG